MLLASFRYTVVHCYEMNQTTFSMWHPSMWHCVPCVKAPNNLHQSMMRSNLCCGLSLTCNCCLGNILYLCSYKVTTTLHQCEDDQYGGTNTLFYWNNRTLYWTYQTVGIISMLIMCNNSFFFLFYFTQEPQCDNLIYIVKTPPQLILVGTINLIVRDRYKNILSFKLNATFSVSSVWHKVEEDSALTVWRLSWRITETRMIIRGRTGAITACACHHFPA